uniref:Uncharacterized protein n=1 Tax=Arundo donax TaxID=35708 RepID=A0A0A9GU78_ARUDO
MGRRPRRHLRPQGTYGRCTSLHSYLLDWIGLDYLHDLRSLSEIDE